MPRRNFGAIGSGTLVVFLTASTLGEPRQSPLKPGDTLPLLAGQTVTGKPLELPAASDGNVSVVIFSFSRAGGRDARNWAQHLAMDDPHLPLYTAIFLESVPRLFRPMAVSAIRTGMPPVMLDRTLLLYQQQNLWEQRLQVADESYAFVLVLGRARDLRWMTSGPFTESVYARLKERLSL